VTRQHDVIALAKTRGASSDIAVASGVENMAVAAGDMATRRRRRSCASTPRGVATVQKRRIAEKNAWPRVLA